MFQHDSNILASPKIGRGNRLTFPQRIKIPPSPASMKDKSINSK